MNSGRAERQELGIGLVTAAAVGLLLGLGTYRWVSDMEPTGPDAPNLLSTVPPTTAHSGHPGPIVGRDLVSMRPGETAVVDVLDNDRDPFGSRIELVELGRVDGGVAAIEESSIRFTLRPNIQPGQPAGASFTVADGPGNEAEGRLEVDVDFSPVDE